MPETYATKFPDYLVGPDEIVMNLTAQSLKDEFLGRVCMTDSGDAVLLNQRLARLTPFGVHPRFVFWVLKSPIFRRFVDQLNTGSLIQHMFTSQLDEFVLPVPPLAEQLRIVARVEEILGGLATVEEAISKTLRRGIVARSSIFVAAFSGKLVSQNPADEPATSLLDRIAADRESDSGPRRTKMPARTRSQRIARTKVTA
jgi:type I restriction enzyme S subunit